MFEEITLHGDYNGVLLRTQTAIYLQNSLKRGRLHKLSLMCLFLGREATSILSQGLSRTSTLKRVDFYRSILEQGRDDDGKADAVSKLAKGLSENQSITELSITGSKLNDSSLVALSKSLADHSVLSKLSLEANICRDESLQSLASLLAAPSCILSHLNLTHQYSNSHDKMNLELLVDGLKQNESLESLDLTGNYLNQDDFAMLWDAIQSGFCSNLVYLNLAYNKIARLAPSNRLNESSRLRRLDLTGNPILKSEDPEIKSFLIDLVQNQPHLGYIGKIVGTSILPSA
jgi:Ran GTPase-activating protein (RanGAP) involved in mRNA processing and transport